MLLMRMENGIQQYGGTLTRTVLAEWQDPKTSLERIQNGMQEEELGAWNLDNIFKKFLLNKNAEKGGIIWKGVRMKLFFFFNLVLRWQQLLFVR